MRRFRVRELGLGVGFAAIVVSLALLAAACGGDDDGGSGSGGDTITVNWGTEPPSLDPGLATDTTSANILLNIMDPLVQLGDDLEPVPSLAESWEESDGGKTVTFKLLSGASGRTATR